MGFTTKLTFFTAFIASFLINPVVTYSSETMPVTDIKDPRPGLIAFTNATIVTAPGNKVEKGTLLINNGKIIEAGRNIDIPDHAVTTDLQGLWIYPSFIETDKQYGLPDIDKEEPSRPQYKPLRKGAFAWNDAIRSDFKAHEHVQHDKKKAEELRNNGFGTVLSHRKDGIARGSGTLITLDEGPENHSIVFNLASAHYSFDKGSSQQTYPRSRMGSIALIRQSLLDAQWYGEGGHEKESNIALRGWNALNELPAFFETNDNLSALQAINTGREFEKAFIIRGSGDEYQTIKQVRNYNTGFIIPLNFPEPFDVTDPYDAREVTLKQLKHWELAPFNPAILEKNNIPFAITASQNKNSKAFFRNLRKAIAAGLSQDKALEALTIQPARFLNAEDKLGSLEEGKLANFIIASGSLTSPDFKIYENWIRGKPFKVNDIIPHYPLGTYQFHTDVTGDFQAEIKKDKAGVWYLPPNPEDTIEGKINRSRNHFTITFPFESEGEEATVRLSGELSSVPRNALRGEGQFGTSGWFTWVGEPIAKQEEEDGRQEERFPALKDTGRIIYPFRAYGNTETPLQEKVLIRNATLWTNRDAGILEGYDLLIENGTISRIEENIDAGDARVINAEGKHVTPGIIDEHAHIAISGGVNEGSHPVTAEVSIQDVVNPNDINIYRQLSGGVTAAQLLHGSANPIGGQSAMIKMRWGASPGEMLFEEAPPFIKFALGENVKQSHWGSNADRFPQTRMGVEQIMLEAFERAKEYRQKHENYDNLSRRERRNAPPPRKDLQLEALLEILDEERFVTCHSYVQSEINMLIHLADSLGFTINTFTHVIDGYKVADKIKEHGAGASAFTDWWNIKPELQDGIPHNTSIMSRKGITTSIQSDNAELGRRLNHEAAKAVKYADLDEQEALKLATLNPAKLLGIDHRVGSLATGMDADLVVWNNHPLSVYAQAEQTFVDGRLYFDLKEHGQKLSSIEAERARIIEKMISAKQNGRQTRAVKREETPEHNCHEEHP